MRMSQRAFSIKARVDAAGGKSNTQSGSLPRLNPQPRTVVFQTKTQTHKTTPDKKFNPYKKTEEIRLKLPPINTVSKTRIHSSYSNSINELKNQNYDLKLQLVEVKTETKLLKKVQQRHTVALQQFHDSEEGVSEVLNQNDGEVRDLQKLLCGTRTCRNNLAWKLQVTEKELTNVKDRIHQLQQRVIKEQALPAKDELSRKLNEVSIELQEKDKRINDLEKCNKLLRGSLNRQAATEHKKINMARKTSFCLQTQVYELSKETRDIKRELEIHNIYAFRLQNQPKKKGKLNKMVQTEVVVSTPRSEVDSRTKSELSEDEKQIFAKPVCNTANAERRVYQESVPQESYTIEGPRSDLEDAGTPAPAVETIPTQPPEVKSTIEKEATEERKPDVVPEQPAKQEEAAVVWFPTPPEPKAFGRSKLQRRKYIFSPVVENLHQGKPAYPGLTLNEYRLLQRQRKGMTLSRPNSNSPAWKSDYIEGTSPRTIQTPQPEAVPSVPPPVSDLESNPDVSKT
ncbi:putative leucine-rich repeat-containing protein DDB_G0290503 [Syngnathoides biaculeatus]|uniref:putative leucine-rich repeat-containing protein DDB_G0290503 n=1 Tax=Syngnathoides biaculeatus TaxID=300417 RepID=UPI002ADD68B3|nr:putative leucine-rich repeat-containing protein DDB_G0290503 [Syngnathoides biaculeatus]